MKNKLHILLKIFCIGLLGCASALPMPELRHIQWARHEWPDADSISLLQGRDLYISKCSGCHSLYEPHSYSPSQWDSSLVVMSKKAKTNAEQTQSIRRYILSIQSQPKQ